MTNHWSLVFETGLEAVSLAIQTVWHSKSLASIIVRRVNSAFAGATRSLDYEIEQFIVKRLSQAHFAVLSEESGLQCPRGAKYFAVLDPIDGTDMALRGLDYFAVCIACGPLDHQKIYFRNIQYSVVCSPLGVFSALRGEGARLNDQLITTSSTRGLRNSILRIPPQRAVAPPLTNKPRSFLYLGSTALEICAVARGHIDGYVESKRRKIFDYAAAGFIATEAGAVLSDINGAPLTNRRLGPVSRSTLIVAANEQLFEEIHRAIHSSKTTHARA